MNTLKEDFKDGIDSGFPLCCVLFFIFRSVFHYITGKYINTTSRGLEFGHIPCPLHACLRTKKSFYCKGCAWTQYGQEICNKCKNCKHDFKFSHFGPECVKCGYARRMIKVSYIPDPKEQKLTIIHWYK